MKFLGALRLARWNADNELELTVAVPDRLIANKLMRVDYQQYLWGIEKATSIRSLQQNNYLWAILGEVGKALKIDNRDLYGDILVQADVKSEFVMIRKQDADKGGIDEIRKEMAVKIISAITLEEQEWVQLQVFTGSSKLNTKQMSELIEYAKSYAFENGIDIENIEEQYGWLR